MRETNRENAAQSNASIVDNLQREAGSSARVEDFYGGIRVKVLDSAAFPWRATIELLTERQHEVWIRRERDHIEVVAKPRGA